MTTIRVSPPLSRSIRVDGAALTSAAVRRGVNITVAALGLVLTAPLMVVIAIAIKLTSPGPVFFKQTRIGLDRRADSHSRRDNRRASDCGGKPFLIFKFRTMAANGRHQNGNGHQVWAQPNDPRVTRLGRWLRLYRLDELPQLLNVLLGDMDVVGPRPEQPVIFAQLRREIERYQERQRVRPGITGWAQINQCYDTCLEDVRSKVQLDLDYIARQSALEDVKIMLRTVPVVLGKRGAW